MASSCQVNTSPENKRHWVGCTWPCAHTHASGWHSVGDGEGDTAHYLGLPLHFQCRPQFSCLVVLCESCCVWAKGTKGRVFYCSCQHAAIPWNQNNVAVKHHFQHNHFIDDCTVKLYWRKNDSSLKSSQAQRFPEYLIFLCSMKVVCHDVINYIWWQWIHRWRAPSEKLMKLASLHSPPGQSFTLIILNCSEVNKTAQDKHLFFFFFFLMPKRFPEAAGL